MSPSDKRSLEVSEVSLPAIGILGPASFLTGVMQNAGMFIRLYWTQILHPIPHQKLISFCLPFI